MVTTMRLVISSDWHGDWVTDGLERHDDLESALARLLPEVLQPDTVFIFLGDLSNPYSRGVHRATALAVEFAQACNRERVPNYWVVGNHDVIEDAHGTSSMQALGGLGAGTHLIANPGVVKLLQPTRWDGEERFGVFLPFTAPARNYSPETVVTDASNHLCDVAPERVLLFGHLNIEGITSGSETSDMPRGRDVFWPERQANERFRKSRKYNGHYHERQVFRGIDIPGSLLRLTHGEEGNTPGFLVHEV
jgi:DNA repair exonuclease SbcCD nuclease subunit